MLEQTSYNKSLEISDFYEQKFNSFAITKLLHCICLTQSKCSH